MSASRVKKSFDKASASYHDYAHVQKDMAEYLVSMLPLKTRDLILEAGCGTGNLTELLIKNSIGADLVINDISPAMLQKCQELIAPLADKKALAYAGDFMDLKGSATYDLVISNAMLQWCQDLKGALLHLKSLIKDHGELAFSSFGPQNFKEIKSLLDIGLDYKGQDEICAILESLGFKCIFKERVIKEYFAGSHELLSYIKHTGVGALNDKPLSFKELRNFMSCYDRDFKEGDKVYITWHQYFIYATL
ncbi:Malonyl-CoA O-methyltransferase BioC [Anaerobiospirillum thomasii]|uniref:methyltransferase n=1 Tax=Anaerobiospirillum thomasii TaxID=179995 RepID=UPI000D9F2058|nr:methyltransferase [Anaerobiospirillum thomasii]SPT71922.1 Malonyl-CoA O-methyltransferase BioC [Anaerobiospirillum thomasii]